MHGLIKELVTFGRSSVLLSLSIMSDNHHLLIWDSGEILSGIHIYGVGDEHLIRTISGISGPTGIAVTDAGNVFVSSGREHSICYFRETEVVEGDNRPLKIYEGDGPGHCDGTVTEWNMPSAICTYKNSIFVCDTGNKAIRLVTSAVRPIPLQQEMAKYANLFRLAKKAKQEELPITYNDHLRIVQDVVAFFANLEDEARVRTGKVNTNGGQFLT